MFSSCPGPLVLLGSDHYLHPVPTLKGPRLQSPSLWVKLTHFRVGPEAPDSDSPGQQATVAETAM